MGIQADKTRRTVACYVHASGHTDPLTLATMRLTANTAREGLKTSIVNSPPIFSCPSAIGFHLLLFNCFGFVFLPTAGWHSACDTKRAPSGTNVASRYTRPSREAFPSAHFLKLPGK